MQTTAEYRALCYQAYNIALERLRLAERKDKPLALVIDCDETIIDNTPAFAENPSWEKFGKWTNSGESPAMPGAVDFLKAVDDLGVNIFYVTNRREKIREATLKNLNAVGFPQADNDHLLLDSGGFGKEERFRKISESYDIAVYMGDSARDFPINSQSKSMDEQNAIADANRELFGSKYIILPNPIYGYWSDEKSRNEAVRSWEP